MKRVGIYAGTFDPIHTGHLAFAREAAMRYKLDKVYFLVEPRPRRKQGVKALQHRFRMVQLAIADEPHFGAILLEQSQFTAAETLPKLQALFAGTKLFMLMGEDVVSHLNHWPHLDELLTATSLIIGVREGDELSARHRLDVLQGTRAIRLHYDVFVPSLYMFASSKIRTDLKRDKEPAGLHPAVLAYIRTNGLYSSADEPK
jgi:nicotinate-nucleotide adenylyltransferase